MGSVSCESEIFDPAALGGRRTIPSEVLEHKNGAFALQSVLVEWHGYAGLQAIYTFLYDWANC